LLNIPNQAEDADKASKAMHEWEEWWKTVLRRTDPLNELGKVCASVQRTVETEQQHLATHRYAAAFLPEFNKEQAFADKICRCSTVDCYRDLMRDRIRLKAK